MKKLLLLLMVIMVAGAASAGLYTEDFTGADPSINIAYGDPVYVGPTRVNQSTVWFGKSSAVAFEDGNVMKIWSTATGVDRFAGIAVAADNFTGGGGNEMTFSSAVTWLTADSSYTISIYESLLDGTGYHIDTTSGVVTGLGGETINQVATWTWIKGGTRNQKFTYTEGTDVIAVYNASRTGAQGKMTLNSINVSVIPEPATIGLFGALGAGLLYLRRKFSV